MIVGIWRPVEYHPRQPEEGKEGCGVEWCGVVWCGLTSGCEGWGFAVLTIRLLFAAQVMLTYKGMVYVSEGFGHRGIL